MIAIDTNVLVRYLIGDDSKQAERARQLIEEELTAEAPGLIGLAAIVELNWVLVKVYGVQPKVVRAIVGELLIAPQIVIEQAEIVKRALALELPDLADGIIHQSGKAAGCAKTVTFDRRFARVADVELLRA